MNECAFELHQHCKSTKFIKTIFSLNEDTDKLYSQTEIKWRFEKPTRVTALNHYY